MGSLRCQGCDKRKNSFPVGGLMVTLLVPLPVFTVPPYAPQPDMGARLLLVRSVQVTVFGQETITLLPECAMDKFGKPGV